MYVDHRPRDTVLEDCKNPLKTARTKSPRYEAVWFTVRLADSAFASSA